MDKFIEVKLDSNRTIRVNTSTLSETQRQVAVSALRNVEGFMDAFVWIEKKIEQLGARLFLKPSLKH